MSLSRGFLLLVLVVAGCSPAPTPTSAPSAGAFLVIGVIGLQLDDPVLADLPADAGVGAHTMATGMGASAALEFLDGREAVEQLRDPRAPLSWARDLGWTTHIDVMDPALRSEPEWVRSRARWSFSEKFPHTPAADLHVVLVSRDRISDEDLARLLVGNGTMVLAGIPRAPSRNHRQRVGGDPDEILAQLKVPVFTRGLGLQTSDVSTLGDLLAPLRGEARQPHQVRRVARWWNAYGGGVLVDDGERIAVGGSRREPVFIGESDPAAASAVVADASPRGDLLVLVRGSEGADLIALEILTSERAEWSGWGIEPIDSIDQASPRYLLMNLAVEPEGDGILIKNAATQVIDIRLLVPLEDAPLIGAPVRDAASGEWLGFDALRIVPWSRDALRLSRSAAFDAERWWRESSAGIDLLWVHEGATPPLPVQFKD